MLKDLIEELDKAKKAVLACLENENCTVDFHGLSFWAAEVERLRNEIKKQL